MPRLYVTLFVLIAAAWAMLTVVTLPDGFPASVDPYGYRTLIAHGVLPSLAVPVALSAWRRRALSVRQTVAVVSTPLGGLALLVALWAAAGSLQAGVELALASGSLYVILGLLLAMAFGVVRGVSGLAARGRAA